MTESVAKPQNALRDANFRRYFIGAVAGVNGMWIFRVLLSWTAWDLTGSASFVGLVAAASLLPIAIAGPVLGAVADRAEILIAFRRVCTGLLLCPLALLVLLGSDLITPPLVLALAVLFGVVTAAYHPVRQSIGPRLVDQPMIGSVVALAALNFNLGRTLSPAVGGLLIGRGGTELAAIVSLLLFLPNLILLGGLKVRATRRATQGALWPDFVAGLRHGLGPGPIRRVLLLGIFALGPLRGVLELLSLIADGQFQRGAEGLGLLTSAAGGGALVAAIVQVLAGSRLAAQNRVRRAIMALGVCAGFGLALAPGFVAAIAAVMVLGFCGTYIGVGLQIGLQSGLADDLRGRIMSLWMFAITLSTSLMALAISLLSDLWGLETAIFALLGLSALVVLWLEARNGRGDQPI